MPDLPISGLPPAGPLTGAEPAPVVQGGVTSQTTAAEISALATQNGAAEDDLGNVTPEDLRDQINNWGAVGNGVVDDTAALQAALNSGLQLVQLQSNKVYRITASLIVPPGVTFDLGGSTIAPDGVATEAITNAAPAALPQTTLTADIADWARSFSVASAANIGIGTVLEFAWNDQDTTQAYLFMTHVTAVAGLVVTIASNFPKRVLAAWQTFITPYAALPSDIQVVNGVLDGTNSPNCHGVHLQFARHSGFSGIDARNFLNGAGGFLTNCYECQVEITNRNCGSTGFADLNPINCANCEFLATSYDAHGFGPTLDSCFYCRLTADAYNSGVVGARGVKLARSMCCGVFGPISTNAYYTGLGITLGSWHNVIVNPQVVGAGQKGGINNGTGIWFSDQVNNFNTIIGGFAFGSFAQDLGIFASDSGNLIVGTRYGTIFNSSDAVIITDKQILNVGLLSTLGDVTAAGSAFIGHSHKLQIFEEVASAYTRINMDSTNFSAWTWDIVAHRLLWQGNNAAAPQFFIDDTQTNSAVPFVGAAEPNRFGTPSGNASAPTLATMNVLLYEASPTNWAGLAADASGNIMFVAGTAGQKTRGVFGQADPLANQTSLFLLVNNSAGLNLQQVTLGAPNSGGAGFRTLQVVN